MVFRPRTTCRFLRTVGRLFLQRSSSVCSYKEFSNFEHFFEQFWCYFWTYWTRFWGIIRLNALTCWVSMWKIGFWIWIITANCISSCILERNIYKLLMLTDFWYNIGKKSRYPSWIKLNFWKKPVSSVHRKFYLFCLMSQFILTF